MRQFGPLTGGFLRVQRVEFALNVGILKGAIRITRFTADSRHDANCHAPHVFGLFIFEQPFAHRQLYAQQKQRQDDVSADQKPRTHVAQE